MIKVNKSIRDLFTKNAEPDFRFTSGFVFPDNLIRSIQVLMNLSSAKKKISSHPDEPKSIVKSSSLEGYNIIQATAIYFTLIFHTVCPS
jgi:hypothetical protein